MTHLGYGHRPPTRHALLEVRDELEIAEKGLRILQRRRDGLVFLFLDLFDRWEDLQTAVDLELAAASALHVAAACAEGEVPLRQLTETRSHALPVVRTETKLFGHPVPMFLTPSIATRLEQRGYGVVGTSALDDELVEAYERLLDSVVRAAEMRAVLLELLREIRRLRVRVNYLQRRLVPELETERRHIERHLAEREQEERYRQFRVKHRREESRRGDDDSS